MVTLMKATKRKSLNLFAKQLDDIKTTLNKINSMEVLEPNEIKSMNLKN